MLKFDLHCHSNISDGVLTPTEVARRAKQNGVNVWALTDHDEVDGIATARQEAQALGVHFISGVEISITWAGRTVHIVGLNIDETNPALVAGLAATRTGREKRARLMAADLEKVGILGTYERALQYVGNPDLVSRTHFARCMVDMGLGESVKDIFKKYLAEGKPGYVPHRWASLEDAVAWITGAGGVAVIAHPGRYDFTALEFDVLFSEFKRLGGVGIEVHTGSHTPLQYEAYAQVAQRYGFLASMGSDFHSPTESRVDLGGLPPLPVNLTPIWQDWHIPQ
jgi:predicted metal-dependent phosphoesterase TrpH